MFTRTSRRDVVILNRSRVDARKVSVCRMIEFTGPEHIPVLFFNRDQSDGDILLSDISLSKDIRSEWGYTLESNGDGTMGYPEAPIIKEWKDFTNYEFPRLNPDIRGQKIESNMRIHDGHYQLATLSLSGFTIYTLLRGFENAMMDFALEKENASLLLDGVMEFECRLISFAADNGFDGICFADDWGTQDRLVISPEMWRKVFKPRYERQFAHAHKLGLQVWFHSCGNITSIVEDFHEIGVDVMNISQPNVVDLEYVGGRLRGKQCFMVPISYQSVSISGSVDDIYTEAERMYRLLGTESGGFIGYVEDYSCLGMSEENYQACSDALWRISLPSLGQRG